MSEQCTYLWRPTLTWGERALTMRGNDTYSKEPIVATLNYSAVGTVHYHHGYNLVVTMHFGAMYSLSFDDHESAGDAQCADFVAELTRRMNGGGG